MTENIMPGQNATTTLPATKRPNETGAVSVEGFIKIFDPTTKKVFVEKRA
jgi:hypothetical protein